MDISPFNKYFADDTSIFSVVNDTNVPKHELNICGIKYLYGSINRS